MTGYISVGGGWVLHLNLAVRCCCIMSHHFCTDFIFLKNIACILPSHISFRFSAPPGTMRHCSACISNSSVPWWWLTVFLPHSSLCRLTIAFSLFGVFISIADLPDNTGTSNYMRCINKEILQLLRNRTLSSPSHVAFRATRWLPLTQIDQFCVLDSRTDYFHFITCRQSSVLISHIDHFTIHFN